MGGDRDFGAGGLALGGALAGGEGGRVADRGPEAAGVGFAEERHCSLWVWVGGLVMVLRLAEGFWTWSGGKSICGDCWVGGFGWSFDELAKVFADGGIVEREARG